MSNKALRESAMAISEKVKELLENEKNYSVVDLGLENLETEQKSDLMNFTNKKVFVIHGHNNEMKLSVARTIEKLNLIPVILHEQANKGMTIFQKILNNSDVSFAIALLSSDDIAISKKDGTKKTFRARQNVILELGFFLGRLGPQNVFILYENNDLFEFPSDYTGVIYTSYDEKGQWMYELVKELKACGFDVDANNIL